MVVVVVSVAFKNYVNVVCQKKLMVVDKGDSR